MEERTVRVRARQGVRPDRESDAGPIPEPMLDDLRHLLWTMEKVTLYWAIGMAIILGTILIGGIVAFALRDVHGQRNNSTAIGGLALATLVAMAYSPFFNRCFDDRLEAKWLREALYPRRLEELADYMAVCQMGGRKKVAARILSIWQKYGLEPGWSARPMDPPPLFQ